MGLPEEQHWTTVHSVTPFPSSDPRPQPCRPSGIFQVPHSSNSQLFTSQHIQRLKAGPAGQLSGDVLIYPPASHQQCLQDGKHIELELRGSPCTLCGFCKIHNNQFYTDRFPETSRIVNDWQWSFFRIQQMTKKQKTKELGGRKIPKCILCS